MHTVLHNHTNPETAYVVDDYPYDRQLRCDLLRKSANDIGRVWYKPTRAESVEGSTGEDQSSNQQLGVSMLYRVTFKGTKFPNKPFRNISTLIEAEDEKTALTLLTIFYYDGDDKTIKIKETTLYKEGRCIQCRKEMPNWPPDDESWKPDSDWGELKPTEDSDGEWYCPECEGT